MRNEGDVNAWIVQRDCDSKMYREPKINDNGQVIIPILKEDTDHMFRILGEVYYR